MRSHVTSLLLAGVALTGMGCRDDGVKVEFYVIDGRDLSRAEQNTIEGIARAAVVEARRLLPALPDAVTIRVQPGKQVIPETGETGTAQPPNTIVWTVDPDHPGGAERVARTWLRGSLFHELHHLVRDPVLGRASILDTAVSEGMATAFERDFAGVHAPWGDYSAEVATWVQQLRALPSNTDRKPWMFGHPDGRRWIAYKCGTYLVDRASRASGKSSADLVLAPTTRVLELAERH